MWAYSGAFIYMPEHDELITGGSNHYEMLQDYIESDPEAEAWIFEEPMLPGHIGRWWSNTTRVDAENGGVYDQETDNQNDYKDGQLIVVFFTHSLENHIDIKLMAQYKEEALNAIKREFGDPTIREATPDEHFYDINSPNSDYSRRRWYTGIEPGQQNLAKSSSRYQAERWLDARYPDEVHNVGGDCANPKCDYQLTDADRQLIDAAGGWFTCPQCGLTYNYKDPAYTPAWNDPGGKTRAGLTPDEMGKIGEDLVQQIGDIPGVGRVEARYVQKNFPVDFIIGGNGVEVKTNHSEAQPRFKLGGQKERMDKIQYCENQGIGGGILGVRLNFYNNNADLFWRPAFTDTWIGNGQMIHIGTYDFKQLNPFKSPDQVPPASELPDDDGDD